MESRPMVSVIMGIYNCERTLSEAIESIIGQTFIDWELIMCDDGSSDNTYQVALQYSRRFPDKIFLIRNAVNRGLNYTLNRCLEKAKGIYIARMDGDDISIPERLEKEVQFLNTHSEYAIVSSQMIYFDEKGDWGIRNVIEIPQIKDFVFHTPFHCHAPCMIREEAYRSVGGYTVDERLLRFEDCNLWYKLYAKGYRGYNIQEALYKMRDDRNAYIRRSPKIRMRGLYVQYIGFRMVHMPLKYYPCLLLELFKCVIISLMPECIYMIIHKRKILQQ